MPPLHRLLVIPAAVALGALGPTARAAQIWTGPPLVFTKPAFADPTLPANQDRITINVWITRASTRGIYNARTESAYDYEVSPQDTEWAFGTTSQVGSLNFGVWRNTIVNNPPSSIGREMVLHLISEDIYIDIGFLSWGREQAGGGAFSYQRSTPGVAREGDFNGDGVVTAADYVVWRDNLGRPESALSGGGDGSGTVDAGDYPLWVDGYGTAAATGAPAPTPSPAGLPLAGFATLCAFAPRHLVRRGRPQRRPSSRAPAATCRVSLD